MSTHRHQQRYSIKIVIKTIKEIEVMVEDRVEKIRDSYEEDEATRIKVDEYLASKDIPRTLKKAKEEGDIDSFEIHIDNVVKHHRDEP